jgi:hypothetical protein
VRDFHAEPEFSIDIFHLIGRETMDTEIEVFAFEMKFECFEVESLIAGRMS